MKIYAAQELKVILEKHQLWLNNEKGGERADLSSANLSSADLSSANLSSANLSSADLSSADLSSADLSSANLSSANLSSADLSSADLRSANLRSANLSSADLRSANLSSANLRSAKNTLLGQQRSDGYQFYLTNTDNGWYVIAGCRRMTIAEYRKHIKTYHDEDKEIETKLILNHLAARLKAYKAKYGKA